jgi:TPR repeat protein/transglutaminase-like putative cysteine protease
MVTRDSDEDSILMTARARIRTSACLLLITLCWLAGAGISWSQESPPASAARGSEHESEQAAEKFSQGPAPAWVVPVQAPATADSQEPQTVRLGDVQIRATAEGETIFAHYLLRANNTAGVSSLGQLTIDFNPAFQSVVLHSLRILRGDTVLDRQPGLKVRFLEREPGLENSIYTGEVTIAIVLEDLRVGDTIDYSYSTVGSNPVFKGVVAGLSTWQSTYPVQLRRVSIQMPIGRKISYRFMGGTTVAEHVAPVWTQKNGFRELLLEQRDIAPYRPEGAYPPGYQPMAFLQYSEYADWNQLARWAAELFQTPPPSGSEFGDLIARLRATPDAAKRAAEALAFVQSEIRYTSIALGESSHRPSPPTEVLRRRYGDCKDKTLLLISIYRALGLDARPVLLGLTVRRGLNGWLPAPTPFDHAIVQLRFKGNTYWLDPTAQQKPHNVATVGRLHGGDDALVADAHSDRPVPIEGPLPESFSVIERVHLDGFDKPATLERTITYTGTMAEDARWSISETAPEEFRKNILNEIQRSYGPAQWAQDISIADDAEANTLVMRERISLTKYAEHVDDGSWILRHRPSMAPFFRIPDTPQRSAPYAIQFPLKVHFLHEVELPPGVTISANDVVHELKNPFFTIRQVQKRQGHTASTEYDFETLSQAVPAEQMNRFLTDLRTVQNDFHTSIFVSASQTGGSGADQDLGSLRSAASRGDAAAQNKLGTLYASGQQGLTQDYAQALAWYRKAAEQNFAEAQFNVGRMFYRGLGTPQDYAMALSWFRKAANQNIGSAQYFLGLMYTKGQGGIAVDSAQAATWYQKSAEKGYPPGEYQLGFLYQQGAYVPKDMAKAGMWYRKAAETGYSFAQAALGLLYAQGDGVPKDYTEAFSWFHKAADQGEAVAENGLGWLYERGLGVQKDEAAAVQWYRKSSDQAYALAQSNLGRMIYFGQGGVPKDHSAALTLWEKAAAQGESTSEFMLGIAYESGEGTVRNLPLAASWYRKAAEQGLSPAQKNLGILYANGNGGVQRDLVQAHMWFNLAAMHGDEQAAKNRETVAAQMTSQQVESAQKLARDWRPIDARASANSLPLSDDCADGQQLCKEGSYLCGVYKRDFLKHGRTCPGVTDALAQ